MIQSYTANDITRADIFVYKEGGNIPEVLYICTSEWFIIDKDEKWVSFSCSFSCFNMHCLIYAWKIKRNNRLVITTKYTHLHNNIDKYLRLNLSVLIYHELFWENMSMCLNK